MVSRSSNLDNLGRRFLCLFGSFLRSLVDILHDFLVSFLSGLLGVLFGLSDGLPDSSFGLSVSFSKNFLLLSLDGGLGCTLVSLEHLLNFSHSFLHVVGMDLLCLSSSLLHVFGVSSLSSFLGNLFASFDHLFQRVLFRYDLLVLFVGFRALSSGFLKSLHGLSKIALSGFFSFMGFLDLLSNLLDRLLGRFLGFFSLSDIFLDHFLD
jgi:hypothetical protein